MASLILAIVLVCALTAAIVGGELIHRRRPTTHDELHGGFRLDLLAGAALTLAVVMCSFMLAISYSAYDAAARDAGTEAGTVAGVYEAASLLSDRSAGRAVQQDIICYARAVASDEWPRLGHANAASNRVEQWRSQLQADIRSAQQHNVAEIPSLRDAEVARSSARQARLATSQRQAPVYLFVLLILVCAVSILLVTAFTIRGMPARMRWPIIGLLTFLLAATLFVIVDLDHPYSGVSTIGPTFLRNAAVNSVYNYEQTWGESVVLCDGDGIPRAS